MDPARAQVALLLDDGLRESVGRNLDSLRAFVKGLPPSVEVLVGYMQNGRAADQRFTTDHARRHSRFVCHRACRAKAVAHIYVFRTL